FEEPFLRKTERDSPSLAVLLQLKLFETRVLKLVRLQNLLRPLARGPNRFLRFNHRLPPSPRARSTSKYYPPPSPRPSDRPSAGSTDATLFPCPPSSPTPNCSPGSWRSIRSARNRTCRWRISSRSTWTGRGCGSSGIRRRTAPRRI